MKVGSLFAGVGGIELGFMNAGFDIAWANEIDKNACVTYRENFSHKLYEDDIYNLNPNKLEPIDILAGGFPCQPFSIAGYRKGFNDDRGNLFFRIIEYVNTLSPKVIFLENVKNLRGHDKGNTFKIIKEAILQNGYSFHSAVLNTKDFGNIPHNRERIFLIGFKNEEDGTNKYKDLFEFPMPEPLNRTILDVIEDNVEDEAFYYRENRYMYKDLVQDMNKKDTVYQWRRKYVRENKSNVCPTLTANMGTGGHNVPLILTDKGIRKLTPVECFEFQGFSTKNGKYKLPKLANSHLYKQAGNSVSVPVIQRIAENIQKTLKGIKCEPNIVNKTQTKIHIDKSI